MLNLETVLADDYLTDRFSKPGFLLPLGMAMIVVKILHELGHGLACRAIGRECHEMGVMLLVFMPCMFCNVSDIWMEPNRWKRILVSSAGIYVEMLIAAICLPLWLLSEPGSFHFFCFSLFLICSVNTLFVNGNPLLRYDGYYVLSDLWQIPNLGQTAQHRVSLWWRSIFFDRETEITGDFHPGIFWYGLASKIYRQFIMFAIMFMIYTFFEGIGLGNTGILLVSILLLISLFSTGVSIGRNIVALPDILGKLNKARTTLFFGLLGLLIFLVAFFPVTTRTFAEGKVAVEGPGVIYSQNDGRIEWKVRWDQRSIRAN